MPKYDFSGLSSDTFEQMIQAIALEKFGPSTIIFGTGTDGGREATYEGQTDYDTGPIIYFLNDAYIDNLLYICVK